MDAAILPTKATTTEPVLSVTANTALDRVILVPDFTFGRTVVATGSTLSMAGKPADVSFVLAELGVSSAATGLAGGSSGRTMVRMLKRVGVNCSFLKVAGRTRVNVVLVQEGTGLQGTVTVPSLKPTYEDGERLLYHVEKLLPGRHWLVLGGSPPSGVAPNLYARMIEAGHRHGAYTLLDAGGRVLLDSLSARPTIVKPNQIELGAAMGRSLESIEDVASAAQELCWQGIEIVCVTMGHIGSVCVTAAEAWHVEPLSVKAINTAGAGDAFGAGMIKALLDQEPLPEVLRWATATATASVLTLGTAECHREDVLRLLPQVQMKRIR
ncbi:MAG: 1-phosphofructokinase family hexose kinase [Anaerolineae bacterium]